MLELIRDYDQIVAYRLPKESETSLDVEFMHRRAERYTEWLVEMLCFKDLRFSLFSEEVHILKSMPTYMNSLTPSSLIILFLYGLS